MSWVAILETDSGRELPLCDAAGRHRGKALLAFLIPLSNLCAEHQEEIAAWLQRWRMEQTVLCTHMQSLIRALWSAGWDYQAHEWTRFCHENPSMNYNEATFNAIIRQGTEKWVEIHALSHDIMHLLTFLPSDSTSETW